MSAAILARIVGFGRALTPRTWLILAALIATLLIALWIYNAGGDAVREDVAADTAKAEAQAGKGREVAATERAIETDAIHQRQQERDHAAEQTPDSVPDDRELRRRCRQLYDAGHRDLPACRGFAGGGQAGPDR